MINSVRKKTGTIIKLYAHQIFRNKKIKKMKSRYAEKITKKMNKISRILKYLSKARVKHLSQKVGLEL